MRSTVILRVFTWLIAAFVGAFFGVAGTVAHTVMWGEFPIGLLVAIISCLALLIAIRALTSDRVVVLAAGGGMLAMLFLFSGGGPGGSVLVPDELTSHIWTWSMVAAIAIVTLWPRARAKTVPGAVGEDLSHGTLQQGHGPEVRRSPRLEE